MGSDLDTHYMNCPRCGETVTEGGHICPGGEGGGKSESILKDVVWIIVKISIAFFVLAALFYLCTPE